MAHDKFMRLALRLARRGYGATSPNPMVGAVLVRRGKIIGRGWHRRAGLPHAEIEALLDARNRGHNPKGATLYVTLEPCSTHGRTPPCSEAIIAAQITRVVVGTMDPNPKHAGAGLKILKRAGIDVIQCDAIHPQIADECQRLNEAFNHWIVRRTPFVTVKAGMTLDGKIATASGESKWITSNESRDFAMRLRQGADAILVGVNTVLADDPSLTIRKSRPATSLPMNPNGLLTPALSSFGGGEGDGSRGPRLMGSNVQPSRFRRIVLDSMARTPVNSKVVSDEFARLTTIVVSKRAPKNRTAALAKRVNVLVAPTRESKIDLRWLMKKLGAENVTSLLVEGGGEVQESFLVGGLAQRVVFFYAPKVLGGRDSRKAVAGEGVGGLSDIIELRDLEWRKIGPDLFLTALS